MTDRRYRIVLPAGWSMIPVREGTAEAIEATVDALLGDAPFDSRAARAHVLRTSLTSIADEARGAGGLDLIVPLVQPWMLPASVSILMSSTGVGPDVTDVTEFTATSATPASAAVVSSNGGPALREQRDFAAPAPDAADCVRTLSYTWLPARGLALMGTASVTAAGFEGYAQIVDALTELADTVLSSVTFDTLDVSEGSAATATTTAGVVSE